MKSHLRINGEATREEKARAYALALERFQVAERERFQSNSAMETFKAARKDLLKRAVIAANELLRAVEDKDKIRLLVQVKGATNAQCVAIRKLINLYSSSKHIQHYTNEIIYTVEALNTEAIKLLTELKPYEKAGVVYTQLDGRGKHA